MAIVLDGNNLLTSGVLNSMTAQSASGTSVDFTGIPVGVKRITVMFNGVSTNGTSTVMVQLGTSSGFETSGYSGSSSFIAVSSAGARTYSDVTTAGFFFFNSVAASEIRDGQLILTLISSNIWIGNGAIGTRAQLHSFTSGSKTLSSALDRVRITTVNGTDTFDAGSINVLYE
jgi:hypothetical protein